MQTGAFLEGLRYLFMPDFSKINPQVMLEALGQAFFTLSLGMGAIMAYGAYMPADQKIGRTAVSVAALTIYDMCKAADKEMTLQSICLLKKEGGKSGHFSRV